MRDARDSFGGRLRARRERQGITLESLAQATKIKRSLLVSLERDDLSQWPTGIYRRAFLREYAAAIGLPPESVVAECLETFPESGPKVAGQPRAVEPGSGGLRLTLAAGERRGVIFGLQRVAIAFADTAAILCLSWVIAWSAQTSFWVTTAATALAYQLLATAWAGRSFAAWAFAHGLPVGVSRRKGVRRGRLRAANPIASLSRGAEAR